MNILIDTNIVLDLLLDREPFVEAAIALFERVERGHVVGYISATTITNIFYIIRKARGREVALGAIEQITVGLQCCTVSRQTVEMALRLNLKDFKDSIQLACATIYQLDGIVTRDLLDFSDSALPIYSPVELLERF